VKLETKTFPLEVKEVEKSGEFSGYLSVFNNIDSYRDIVMPGAFAESLAEWNTKGRLPPVLWQHRSGEPIGPFTKMQEDTRGLYVEGRLLVNDLQRAKEAHALMQHKVISGMSIGFETIGEEWDKDQRVRKLTKVKLWEGSIVTFPANEAAQVEAVKSLMRDGHLPDLKSFEDFLREAGFSKTQATAIASHGLSYLLRSESEGAGDDAKDGAAILADLKTITLK
jgi:HK97 family phage prohead protease